MKILQLALSLGAGGAERLVLGLCNEHADNTDDEIVLVTLKDNSISKNVHYLPNLSKRVRFINLPTGSTYSIQETDKGEDEGFQFVDVVTAADNGGTAGTVSGADRDTVTGTIDKPNNVFSATYTNKWLTKEIQIVKIDENGDMLADATFTLTKGRNTVSTFTSKSTEGNTQLFCLDVTMICAFSEFSTLSSSPSEYLARLSIKR